MDRCRRPKIPGRSKAGVITIFPPGDGERCLGRDVGRGEGRSHDAALPLRTSMGRGDGGRRFYPSLVATGATSKLLEPA